MNRAQRRAKAREQRAQLKAATTAITSTGRIPVFSADGLIEDTIDRNQVERYRKAPNAHVVTDEQTGETRVVLDTHSDDRNMIVRRGNPRRYSHDHENEKNPPRVWMLRRLAKRDRDLYRSSILDCIDPARKQVITLDIAIAKAERKAEKQQPSKRRAVVRAIDALKAEREKAVKPLAERLKVIYSRAA